MRMEVVPDILKMNWKAPGRKRHREIKMVINKNGVPVDGESC